MTVTGQADNLSDIFSLLLSLSLSHSSVAGPVLGVKLIPDRNFQNGGIAYGFVEYHDMRSAENALQTLHGRKIFEHEIKVNWAHQNTGAQKEDLSQHFHVFVGDISPEVNDEILKKAFAAFGSLTDARVMWDLATGKSRGYGFLAFKEKADAEQAINAMNGEWLGSRAIRVNWANQRTGGVGGEPGMPGSGGPARISNLPPFLGPPGAPGVPAPGGASADPSAENGSSSLDQPSIPSGPSASRREPSGFQPVKPLTYDVIIQQAPPSNTVVYVGNLAPGTEASQLLPLFQGFGYISESRVHQDRGFAFLKLDTHHNAAQAIVNVNGTQFNGRTLKCHWGRDKLGSDTSILAAHVNDVTSPSLEAVSLTCHLQVLDLSRANAQNRAQAKQSFGGYAGWPYGFNYAATLQNSAPLPTLSSAQAAYYQQYYGLPNLAH